MITARKQKIEVEPLEVADGPRWVRWEAAAAYSGLSKKTLQRHYRAGEFPIIKLRGGQSARALIDLDDLDTWLESRKRTGPDAT
jgi:predicted DNA-binding transcriptional regulator AlpA